jgi:poly-gamma-glutamate synthesis protein (capsule biosynthesis protein)
MAFESEDIRKRQQRRKQEAQRRREQQRRFRRRLTVGLIAAAVVLALCGLMILLLQQDSNPTVTEPSEAPTNPIQAQPSEPETVINIAFGGDLNVTDRTVAAGVADGGYDYTDVFMDIVPLLAGSDAAVLNLEGNLVGAPYGTQSSSAPQELMNALRRAGVDLIQMANSCSINNGLLGLRDTLDSIRQAGMEPLGAYGSSEEFEASKGFTLRSIRGVKVAFVSFTKGMDSMGLPAGSENCVNLLYTDYTSTYQKVNTAGITKILRDIEREKPDVTIALLHWGSEYNNQISGTQAEIVKLMQKEGVDAIVGTHSHYVQSLEYDAEKGTVVAYSLGDFFGDSEKSYTNSSVIVQLEITKDNTAGTAKITGMDYTPIYTMTPERDGVERMKILRIPDALSAYEADGMQKVSPETYAAMKSAMSRIKSRMEPDD